MRAHDYSVVVEVEEAIETYEEQRPGRGERFAAALRATFARIEEAPLAFARTRFVRRPTVRRAKVLRFPYVVFYYVLRGEPYIVAVAHGKRAEGYWRTRMAAPRS